MTNKIYEYKDDQDWYVGVWDVYGGIYSLIKDPLDLDFMDWLAFSVMRKMVFQSRLR